LSIFLFRLLGDSETTGKNQCLFRTGGGKTLVAFESIEERFCF